MTQEEKVAEVQELMARITEGIMLYDRVAEDAVKLAVTEEDESVRASKGLELALSVDMLREGFQIIGQRAQDLMVEIEIDKIPVTDQPTPDDEA